MEPRRSLSPQEVPEGFAALLHRLRKEDHPLLNVLLVATRSKGWRTPVLARELGIKPTAINKRVERARRMIAEAGWTGEQIADQIAAAAVPLAVTEVPEAPRVHRMVDGRQLSDDQVERLREMQRVASRVNGATPADHPSRRISEQLSAELNQLVADEGYSSYYLAGVLGRSPRAITSRLERHHFREPCPSVAGTASGEYHARKIGDPGEGAPRIPAELRAELRAGWATSQDAGDPAALRLAVRAGLRQGFTWASLAQVLRVSPGELRRALDELAAGARAANG